MCEGDEAAAGEAVAAQVEGLERNVGILREGNTLGMRMKENLQRKIELEGSAENTNRKSLNDSRKNELH